MARHTGWDVFNTKCEDKVASMTCRVCNQKMKVERNVDSPTSWAGAIQKISHLHDVFTCKNSGKKWHNQVRRLRQEIMVTPSAKLAAIYLEEINEILKSKKPSKEVDEL